MAQWMNHLHIKNEWQQAKRHEITNRQLAKAISVKLAHIAESRPDDSELQDLVMEFEGMAEDEQVSDSAFNSAMESLYDWGDTPLDNEWNGKKMCWIETNF